MRESNPPTTFDWTISLGRWGSRPVRLHVFFVLAVIGSLYLSWLAGQREMSVNAIWLAALSVAIVTVSVAAHAAAHIYAATQLHVPADSLIIGPHGDFAESLPQAEPRAQLAIALAGPGVNLLIALACLPGVIAASESSVWPLLNPVSPHGLLTGPAWLVAWKLTLWFNWTLAIVNLLPARPFDGGPAALSIAQLLYTRTSRRRVERFVSRLGVFTGIGLLLAAALVREDFAGTLAPAWLPLLLTGIVVLFARQHSSHPQPTRSSEDELFGYDFSQGYTSLEKSHARVDEAEDDGPLERWLETRKQQRRERQEQLEAEEDALVDEILARVHQHGLGGLTSEERSLLDRASMRYRTRTDPP